MEFTYQKNDNTTLFKSVTKENGMNLENPQNYIPIYDLFFSLTPKNYDDINLNHTHQLREVKEKKNSNVFSCIVDNNEKDVFFKYSPLLDPPKYLMGKYSVDDDLFCLPRIDSKKCHAKMKDPNNSAYVDSFFNYLSSILLHEDHFIHALDFYGSFIANKNDYEYNLTDDIDVVNETTFFHENLGKLFSMENEFMSQAIYSRKNKKCLQIDDTNSTVEMNDIIVLDDLNIEQCIDNSNADLIFSYDTSTNKSDKDVSECSSTSSATNQSNDETETSDTSDDYSTATEDDLMVKIPKFPVHVIAMEKCHATLDSLIIEKGKHMTCDEWSSMLFQVIVILFTYQKVYNLTHNDLHTNNIMYNKTDKIKGNYYKVPTFGRIYKIIDYGRSIYKFRGQVLCSDSYHKKGDAATQYNFEPYFNPDKSRIEPNFSFDLCRLGCSLLYFFIDFIDDATSLTPIKTLIEEWCQDDKGRNVLYKTNGEERYPNFKLYKMIARTVHKHVPENQLSNECFTKYKINKKKIKNTQQVMNLDILPLCV